MPFIRNEQTKLDINNLQNEIGKLGLNDEAEINYNDEQCNDYESNQPFSMQESCPIGSVGQIKKIDMKVIEPYTRVLRHGGYYTNRSDQNQAIGGRSTLFLFLLLFIFLFYKTLN